MSRKRLVTMVGGTITCALAIGFFMQRGETSSPRNLVAPLPSAVQQTILKPAASAVPASGMAVEVETPSDMPNLVLAPAMTPPSLPEPSPGMRNPAPDAAAVPAEPGTPKRGCDVIATATAGAKAMVKLQVSAPCFTNQRVTIHHNGMMFTQATDEEGQLSVTVPALSERAVFIVDFGNGKGAVALSDVAALADYERVAVQWTGNAGFQIHAREFGAAYGSVGHVWSGAAPGGQGSGGFITRLGDSETMMPHMVEIYTFPSGTTALSGVVALSVEAEVTAANCGRDISAQSLELRDGLTLRTRDLVLTMPDCAALGDFLVLNNLVDDLKIAAR